MIRLIITISLLFILSSTAFAADRYWIAATSGNWSDANNWSTSSGGLGGASIPTASDDVYFDFGTSICTIDINAFVNNITIKEFSGNILLDNTVKLTVSRNFFIQTGSFLSGAGTLSVGKKLSIVGGVFQASSVNTDIGNSFFGYNEVTTIFEHTGGTFQHNSGQITCNSLYYNTTSAYGIMDVLPSTAFNDFVVDIPNQIEHSIRHGGVQVQDGDTLIIEGNLTHTDGAMHGYYDLKGNLNIGSNAGGGRGWIMATGAGNSIFETKPLYETSHTCNLLIRKDASFTFEPAPETSNLAATSLKIESGSFIAPPDSLLLGGKYFGYLETQTIFHHRGGSFMHNNGKVILSPKAYSVNQSNFPIYSDVPTEFYDLYLDMYNTDVGRHSGISSGTDTFFVKHDLHHEDGRCEAHFKVDNDIHVYNKAYSGRGKIEMTTSTPTNYHAYGNGTTAHLVINKGGSNTVTAASGTNSIGAFALEIKSGHFTAPIDTLFIGFSKTLQYQEVNTPFAQSGGSFDANNATVYFDARLSSSNQSYFTFKPHESTRFHHFVVDLKNYGTTTKHGQLYTVATDTLRMTGNITLRDGLITGNIATQANLIVEKNFSGGFGWVIFEGDNDGYYRIDHGVAKACGISVEKNNASITPYLDNVDTLQANKFQMLKGHFKAPSTLLTIGNAWFNTSFPTLLNMNGGTFDHNQCKTRIRPSASSNYQNNYTLKSKNTFDFYDFEIAVSNGNLTRHAGVKSNGNDTIRVANNLHHTDGALDAVFSVQKDFYVTEEAGGGFGWVIFEGPANSAYNYPANAGKTGGFTINKSNASVDPMGATNWLRISRLRIDAGNFTAPSTTLSVGEVNWATTGATLFQHTGGTLNPNNGTTVFEPTINRNYTAKFYATPLNSTSKFYNLEVNIKNSGVGSVFTGLETLGNDTLFVGNNLTLRNGILHGNIGLEGNLTVCPEHKHGVGLIKFLGTNKQTYGYESTPVRTSGFHILKSSSADSVIAASPEFSVNRLLVEQGVFKLPNDTLFVGGMWNANNTTIMQNWSTGNYDANTATLVFDPEYRYTSAGTFRAITSNDIKFDKIKLDLTNNDVLQISSADTILIEADLILKDGKLINGSAPLAVAKNLSIASTFDGITNTLVFCGSEDQYLDVSENNSVINGDVEINKPSGQLILNSKVILDESGKKLRFNGGVLKSTSANRLIIGNHVNALVLDTTSYVEGPVYKYGTHAFLFPVGTDGVAAPLEISAPMSASDTFKAERFSGFDSIAYPHGTSDPSLSNINTCGWWKLDRLNGTSAVRVTLTNIYSENCKPYAPEDLRICRWDGTQWRDHGQSSNTGNKITSQDYIPNFSPFTIGASSGSNPLPVNWLEMTASRLENKVVVSWSTASEVNCDNYYIERSNDGANFETIGTENCKNSNLTSYAYDDDYPLLEKAYYRVKQVDYSGKYSYSKIGSVEAPIDYTGNTFGEFIPNPAYGSTSIIMNAVTLGLVSVSVLDVTGVTAYTTSLKVEKGLNDLQLDLSFLASGVYIVVFQVGSDAYTKKLHLNN